MNGTAYAERLEEVKSRKVLRLDASVEHARADSNMCSTASSNKCEKVATVQLPFNIHQ